MKRFLTIVLSLALLLTLAVPALAFEKVKLSTQNLMVNGKPADCEKYNIDGSNYFKLRDLAALLDGTESQFDVGWDGAKKLVTLTTNHAYTTARGDELTVGTDQSATTSESGDALIIDGVERKDIAAYKIGGSNFFRLRDLGNALGFDVDFIKATNTATVASRSSLQVTDLCREAGQYIERSGYVNNYSYALPRLSGLDTEFIRAVNAEMLALRDSDVSWQLQQMQEGGALTRYCISYCYGERYGVRSLLVTADRDADFQMSEYRCYSFDAMGEWLDNDAVLAAAGLTAEDFIALARAYLEKKTDLSAYFQDDGWKQYQADTVSSDNLNADVPMAILPNGNLCFICRVYTSAGAGYNDAAFEIGADRTVSEAALESVPLDRLQGCYLAEDTNGGTLFEFVAVGDTLMLECTYLGRDDYGYYVESYSAAELFPQDPAALYRADADALRFRAVSYNPDAFGGSYSGDAVNCTLRFTADGIVLAQDDGPTFTAAHCYKSDLNLSEALPEPDFEHFDYDAVAAAGISGVWAGTYRDDDWQLHTLTLELTSWGEMKLRDCTSKAIPTVLQGYFYIAGANDDTAPADAVVFNLARRGGYKMPVNGWCRISADPDGTLHIAEDPESYGHLTKLNENEENAVLRRAASVRRLSAPSIRALGEDEPVSVDIAGGTPAQLSYHFVHDADNPDDIAGITVTVNGKPFTIVNMYAYGASVCLVTPHMGGTAWLYIDCLSDNDYHFLTVVGVRPDDVWWAGEFMGGFAAAPTDPEALQIWSRFHLVSTVNATRAYRVGLSGCPEPVDSFYRIESDVVLTSKVDIDGWSVDGAGELEEFTTIPVGTALKPIRTDGAGITDLQLPNGSVCRVWSSGVMGNINGTGVFDCFDGTFFAG